MEYKAVFLDNGAVVMISTNDAKVMREAIALNTKRTWNLTVRMQDGKKTVEQRVQLSLAHVVWVQE